jgi:DNA-binding NarL/FixJ family response regulator
MDGFEAVRKIRALIQAAFDAGASGYILKPDANSDLFQGIAAALGDRQFISRSLKDLAQKLRFRRIRRGMLH